MFWFPGLTRLFMGESGVFSLVLGAFTIWMLIECLRREQDRYYWWWLILFVPGIGPVAYFVIRWMPEQHLQVPGWLRKLTRGSEIRRLESAALQIGNPYQYVQLGDALRETGQLARARDAYSRALEKEPSNLPALWGVGLIDVHFKAFDSAREHFEKVLQEDPQYKFGDASLAYAKSLLSLDRTEEAMTHLEKHVKRWRHPEGIYMLALLDAQSGLHDEARMHLRSMLAEIDSSPLPIARKQGRWRRRGLQLLRKLR